MNMTGSNDSLFQSTCAGPGDVNGVMWYQGDALSDLEFEVTLQGWWDF